MTTGGAGAAGPFGVLGLPPDLGVTDDDVRAAWRRIAAATHPDRADGGDPERFAAAAAAYTALRTPSARGELLADLAAARPPGRARARRSGRPLPLSRFAARIARGRPGRLALRAAAVLAVSGAAIAAAGSRPATPALVTGALTWLVLTGRGDLAPARASRRERER